MGSRGVAGADPLTLMARLGMTPAYLDDTEAGPSRRGLVSQAIGVAQASSGGVPARGTGTRFYKSSVLALEAWMAENLALLASENVSAEARRDLEAVVYCAVAAAIASQQPNLEGVMRAVVETLTHDQANAVARTDGVTIADIQSDGQALARDLAQLEREGVDLKDDILRSERRLARRVRELDALGSELLAKKSHLESLRMLLFDPTK